MSQEIILTTVCSLMSPAFLKVYTFLVSFFPGLGISILRGLEKT